MLTVKIDTHTHSIASIHAYSTIYENIQSAKQKKLTGIAITDHAPGLKETFPISFFGNMRKAIPQNVEGIHVFKGIEANVIDHDGNLDIPTSLLNKLDLVIASCHETVVKPLDINTHTKMYEKILQNPWVDIIGHPGNGNYTFDYEYIIKKAKEYQKIIEINSSSFPYRKNAQKNCYEIATLCKKHDVNIVVSSDAHFVTDIGNFEAALAMLESIDFPQKLIVNESVDKLIAHLPKYQKMD